MTVAKLADSKDLFQRKEFAAFLKTKGFNNPFDFYHQGFDPNELKNIFKGWTEEAFDDELFIYKDKICFIFDRMTGAQYYEFEYNFTTLEDFVWEDKATKLKTPFSLADFINDCLAHDIDLEWNA